MQKLVQGIHQFQNHVFNSQRDLFQRLAEGQNPETLFITCSDSRVNPNLLTQTDPGDLFILRNAGNIIPPYGAPGGGEAATIEYAIAVLGVKDVIVCGHSLCGAMTGLLAPDSLKDLPSVAKWLRHAEATRQIIKQNYSHLEGHALLTATVEENVLVQLENLRTHPSIAVGLSRGNLTLHAWVYQIESGQVFAYDPSTNQFLPLTDVYATREPELALAEQPRRDGWKTRRLAEAIGP
jgi:carbonic anhydrase